VRGCGIRSWAFILALAAGLLVLRWLSGRPGSEPRAGASGRGLAQSAQPASETNPLQVCERICRCTRGLQLT
jgi:hypothetical protein